MSRNRHQPMTHADVATELILAGADVGWVRASGAPRPERRERRRSGARRRRNRR